MENASNALIIAATVLIAILIISMGVYLYSNFQETSDTYFKQLDSTELQKYNSNFDVYIGRTDITPQEIVTLISIAQQKEQGTKIFIQGETEYANCMDWVESDKSDFLAAKIEKAKSENNGITFTYKYVEDSALWDENGRIIKMEFKQN